MTLVEGLAYLPGGAALVGVAMGYGGLRQQVKSLKADVDKIGELEPKVTRIDERTKNTDQTMRDMRGQLNRLVEHVITRRMQP